MMSLVAYEESSDEESDQDKEDQPSNLANNDKFKLTENPSSNSTSATVPNALNELNSVLFNPTNELGDVPLQSLNIKFNLPTPIKSIETVEEDDDEFLRKKPIPSVAPTLPKPSIKKGPTRITIPSLAELDANIPKVRIPTVSLPSNPQANGLLNLLPRPKNEILSSKFNTKKLIPHSVTTKRVVTAAKTVRKGDQIEVNSKLLPQPIANKNDSDQSDGDEDNEMPKDFFSFNTDDKLPEISDVEINAMVAKKAAEIAGHIKKSTESTVDNGGEQLSKDVSDNDTETQQPSSSININDIGTSFGRRSKRFKKDNVQIIDLSHDQVLPNKDEWLRNHLQATTEYTPKGMVDQEVLPGTRKKHQITYLAHQAKANEQELQAMWAANRHTRRQTQSKYGF